MIHDWQNIDGTLVLINSNDGKTPLAYINEIEGVFYLNVPYLKLNLDLKDTSSALKFMSLNDAKQSAEKEVQSRIDQFISPGN